MTVAKRIAVGPLLVGMLGLLLLACGNEGGSARDFIGDTYGRSGSEAGAAVFRSTDPPAKVVQDILNEENPANRLINTRGTFLRYRNDYVGVLPGQGAGSRVLLADEDDGYRAFFPYIGSAFGQFDDRGGGPGDGGK